MPRASMELFLHSTALQQDQVIIHRIAAAREDTKTCKSIDRFDPTMDLQKGSKSAQSRIKLSNGFSFHSTQHAGLIPGVYSCKQFRTLFRDARP